MGIIVAVVVVITLISIEVQLRRLNKTNEEMAVLLKEKMKKE
ncbi:hypothetical protein [Sporosarcina aquimarina]|uniref:Uncharacterized protein n=1 Tax=Sporosarcina aquimarina TaxID=114975 RepID=A0ABU4G0V7_9BACL|nr:hypothetical protein [Sporosarcina aquimarina]MDW0110595.1 hypothetical protein [Sporosarcina aquimarina]